jgi:hypothetical protein
MIGRPQDEVFAFLADLENDPRWNPAIEADEDNIRPVRVGTTYRQVRSAPKRSEESFEITAFDPPRRLVFEGDIGPFQARIGYALETVPEATRLTNWVEPSRRRSSRGSWFHWRHHRSGPR